MWLLGQVAFGLSKVAPSNAPRTVENAACSASRGARPWSAPRIRQVRRNTHLDLHRGAGYDQTQGR
jgi:hypothetical protein